jgi:hypothetical protein
MKKIITTFLAICMLLTCVNASSVQSLVRSVEGFVEYQLPNDDTIKPLRVGLKLPSGTKIMSGDDGKAIIRVTPGAAMRIAPNTTLTLSEMAFAKDGDRVEQRKARVALSSGTISALLDHRDPEATDFKIETPQGSAAARGTFYGVSVVDDQTFVSVKEGKVGVSEKDSAE